METKRYSIEKGNYIYKRGDTIDEICVLLTGSIKATNEYTEMNINKGSLIGLINMGSDKYLFDYVATEDCVLFAYKISSVMDIEDIINANPSFSGVVVSTINKEVILLYEIYSKLLRECQSLYSVLKDGYERYLKKCSDLFIDKITIEQIDNLQPVNINEDDISNENAQFYKSIISVSPEAQKSFLSANSYIPTYLAMQMSRDAFLINSVCKVMIKYLVVNYRILLGNEKNDLFYAVSSLMYEAGLKNEDISSVQEIFKDISNLLENGAYSDKRLFKEALELHNDRMSHIDVVSKTGENKDGKLRLTYSEKEIIAARENLKNSLDTILKYSEWEEERANSLRELLTNYRNVPDRKSPDKAVTELRKNISKLFYDLYTDIFFKAEKEHNSDPIINMFLSFGFMDERLISENDAIFLYYLELPETNVFSIRQWLRKIYKGEKLPSKNEFDVDYIEQLKEIKKQRDVTEAQENAYINDMEARVKFEINNLFKVTNKLTFGFVSKFCPVLSGDNIVRELSSSIVTAEILNKSIADIVKVDYSLFYRECTFYNPEVSNNKEPFMKEVYPDIILMPNFGAKAVMWQEIEGKQKDTPARFVFSLFTVENIDELMINVLGRFRWEMCKAIQGFYWNDIAMKSLTSEYSDYLQFYKKNKELSETAKEKIKSNLVKKCNNYKEYFVSEYIQWIRYEANGSIRLNNISRRILLTYCPFRKEVRNELMANPIFKQLVEKYNKSIDEKIARLQRFQILLEKKNIPMPQEFLENIEFYSI